ncbi:hypothetical protein [Primorskyibacter sp. S87]|uniref:hypothetical protein n=1 Tax=Primorskyibacter sp. S87 TaxID=3415126 RepID=UPI003C79C237
MTTAAVGLALLALILSGCTTQPLTVTEERHIVTRARVQSVDPATNRVKVLSGAQLLTLKVREDFGDVSDLQVGDRIRVDYYSVVTVSASDADIAEQVEVDIFRLGNEVAGEAVVGKLQAFEIVAEFVHFDPRTRIVAVRRSNGDYFYFFAPIKLRHAMTRLTVGDRLLFKGDKAIAISLEER